jgi:hypothetical protein
VPYFILLHDEAAAEQFEPSFATSVQDFFVSCGLSCALTARIITNAEINTAENPIIAFFIKIIF